MPKPRRTVTEIFRDDEGRYSRRVRFVDADRFHHVAGGSATVQEGLDAADPFQEYVWRDPPEGSSADAVLVSTEFKPGSAAQRMSEFDPEMLRK